MTERYTKVIENPGEVQLGKYQILRPLTPEEYQALKERIAISGIEEMIKVDSDFNVIDGHHRVMAWGALLKEGRELPKAVQIEVMTDLETEEQKFEKACELNGPRRHLEVIDKGQLIRDQLEQYPQWSNRKIASLVGVGHSSVHYWRERLLRAGRIQPEVERVGLDNVVQPVGERTNGGGSGGRSRPPEKPKKTINEIVAERLTENPEFTARTISEQTGAATWLVDGIREKMVKEGTIPAPPSIPAPERRPGALEVLEEAGIELPPPPVGKTYEERVYTVLAHFRDTMLSMPSDPKAVARSIEITPFQAAATVDDFGELTEWLKQFHEELAIIAKGAKENAKV